MFMDRISRCSQRVEMFQFGGLRISSLLFADDVVLLSPLDEMKQMRMGTSKSETKEREKIE